MSTVIESKPCRASVSAVIVDGKPVRCAGVVYRDAVQRERRRRNRRRDRAPAVDELAAPCHMRLQPTLRDRHRDLLKIEKFRRAPDGARPATTGTVDGQRAGATAFGAAQLGS